MERDDLRDTSIHIGLEALDAAARTWSGLGYSIDVGAVFVEKDPRAFRVLETYLAGRPTSVAARPLHAEFGEAVPEIRRIIGADAAFVFVDPTGWKGAGMHHIAPLLDRPRRDVMVNVMFDHLNRFVDDPRTFLRSQMREFFGIGEADVPKGLDEEDLIAFYRSNLKASAGIAFAADLAVPYPAKERTKLRLVVGGRSAEVVRLIRDVEQRVIGVEASPVRVQARARAREERTRQLSLTPPAVPDKDGGYVVRHQEGLAQAESPLYEEVAAHPPISYAAVWPRVLERCHVTESDLKKLILGMANEGRIVIQGRRKGERALKDRHLLAPGRSIV